MNITSFGYFCFVGILLIAYYTIVPKKNQWVVLLVGSLVFFVISSKYLIVYLLVSTLVAYCSACKIDSLNNDYLQLKNNLEKDKRKELKKQITKKQKITLIISIVMIIGVLVVLKYSNFFGEIVNDISNLIINKNSIPVFNFLIPIGISYYSLMLVGYITDVYRGHYSSERNYLKLLLFASYFPHIIEGPFDSYSKLSENFNNEHTFNYDSFINNIALFVTGLIKKLVIADKLSFLVNEIFTNYNNYSGLIILIGMIGYAVNIYMDFSGCIDIVNAISSMFGIEMEKNFDRPFFSKNVQEFWRRWHMSFGVWLKNYVFYPVTLSKLNRKIASFTNNSIANNIVSSFLPQLCVWLVMGLWHGASWKYVIYGLYFFAVVYLGIIFKPLTDSVINKCKVNRESVLFIVFSIVKTLVIVVFGLAIFKSNSIEELLKMINRLFMSSSNIINVYDNCIDNLYAIDYVIIAILSFAVFLLELLKELKVIDEKKLLSNVNLRWIYITLSIIIIILFGVYGSGYVDIVSPYAEF